MKKMCMKLVEKYFLLLLCVLPCILRSQHAFDTVQVTTSQIPLRISETGRNITVLTSKDITSMPATSLDEILQTVTGLEIQSRGGFGVQGDILLRGSTFTQVLVLVDGLRINDPLTGHFNSYIPITPAEIERIEVLRGAASAMYGADAVSGVVNIITKTFSARKGDDQVEGRLSFGDNKLVSGY